MTVAVGGLLENPALSYSLVEAEPDTECVLSLPPLPQRLMLDPLVSLVNETILLCSADYESYRANNNHKHTQCWRLNLGRRPRVWVSVQSPLRSLFLPTFTSHGSKIFMLGGSEELLAGSEMSLMSGTKTVQTYDVLTNTWHLPPAQLPAPLFEGCAVSTSQGLVVIGDFEAGLPNAYISQEGEAQWRSLPVSNFAHTNPACSLVTINNLTGVLVISGLRAELLRLEDNIWIKLPQLKIRRFSELRPTVGTSLGRVVVVGGVDRDTGQVSDVIEVWDEEARDWVVSRQVMDNRRTRQTELLLPVRYFDSCVIKEEAK